MSTGIRLRLLGGFGVASGGNRITLPVNAQRVLAFLALQRRAQSRTAVAASLWLDGTEERAGSNLRTALWRIRELAGPIVSVGAGEIEIDSSVLVDVHEMATTSRALMRGDSVELNDIDPELFCRELLPDWDEEWLLLERERIRQLRMHALERICGALTVAGRHGEAIDAGLAAIEAEPLRESAQRAVIEAHLAEGNRCEAVRVFARYRELLLDSLGLEPSHDLRDLIGC
jgi:DNA-binding SARP family transcriptional activator